MRRGSPNPPRRGPSRVGKRPPLPAPPAPATPSDRAAKRDVWTTARVQAALRQMADRLRADLALLKRIYGRLDPPPDLLARQEGSQPYDVGTELLGGLEDLVDEAIPDLIESLDRLAAVTDEELEQRFEHFRAQQQFPCPPERSSAPV